MTNKKATRLCASSLAVDRCFAILLFVLEQVAPSSLHMLFTGAEKGLPSMRWWPSP